MRALASVNKTLLIIGAGTESCEGIKIARAMGLSLIVADADRHAPGFNYADYRLHVSTYDAAAMTLYYDADGNGTSAAAVEVANFTQNVAITAGNLTGTGT